MLEKKYSTLPKHDKNLAPHILFVDDRPDVGISARFLLEDHGYSFFEAASPDKAKAILAEVNIDLILFDMNYSMDTTSGEEGLDFLRWLGSSEYNVPAIAMTAWSNVPLVVKAMQLGAVDFIEKPWNNQQFLHVVQQQLTLHKLQDQNCKLQQRLQLDEDNQYSWRSPCMITLLRQLEDVAATDITILLSGENGTGKNSAARFIHERSQRKNGPFISVNMGSIAESLFESEMFGHKKWAFTDAKSSRIGRFELADQGTLFLDEIANIPLSQQAKLLRVLESREYEVLGSSKTQFTNTRLVSATNGDIRSLIATEKLREDLFYRLNTLKFRLPSLKERQDDILPLALHFIKTYARKYLTDTATLTQSAERALKDYHWPGNIRELDHLMLRSVLLTRGGKISSSDLQMRPNDNIGDELPQMPLEQLEKMMIRQALNNSGNSIPKAAALLGLTKSSLYRRLEKYGDIQH
ncbi:sigma-54-dependent Fis family transcriptional regulator [Cellvibrio mixtus]|uniref:Sigma-54-dependent Fis family transcriptional regulator n=1 Tax=Cellvibrio mixtus TaxID=39650 RepID=A0A266QAJ4_9GAMM|nr:sigma-54 dependent transcriptional regulator [Cellvibrio mixtus]OZY86391.1 sigma-54-dependent Fis family transcriptional regulator [Cellvibrio mixtus]